MNIFFTRAINKLRNVREVGMTMVEIVVALALLGIVTTFATTTMLNTTATSQNFNKGVQNEGNLLDAISLISRDVSLASGFQYASSDALAMTTTDSGSQSQVFYFRWTGAAESIPAGAVFDTIRANQSKLPAKNGIIEYRVVNNNTANPVIRNLIPNYNPGGTSLKAMFTYHDTAAKEILLDAAMTPPRVSDSGLKGIRRVEMHFTSYIENRDNPMIMHTSAVPRLMGLVAGSQSNSISTGTSNVLPSPVVNGNLPQKTNSASLWWGAVSGADSYTVYYMKDGNGTWDTLTTLEGGSGKMTAEHKNLTWGSDYSYKVVAYDHLGPSNDSNFVNMRVTPQPTDFNNVDSLRAQPIANYTVARELQNSLYWDKVAGKETKYRIRAAKNGASYSILWDNKTDQTNVESGKNYGDRTNYTVTAFNDIVVVVNPDGTIFNTGGEASASPAQELISPPIRPVITVTEANDIIAGGKPGDAPTNTVAITNINSITTETAIRFFTNDSNAVADEDVAVNKAANTNSWVDDMKKHSSYSSNKGWGTRNYYYAVASNDAGRSPVSASARADQHPGPFDINSLRNTKGYFNYSSQNMKLETGFKDHKSIGTMTGSWGKSLGASNGYEMTRGISNALGAKSYITGNVTDPNTKKKVSVESDDLSIGSNTTSFSVNGVSPGVIYTVDIKAKASNGLSRKISSTLLTKPDVPQSGIQEGLCLANGAVEGGNQQYAMYVMANTLPKNGKSDEVVITYKRDSGGGTTTETRNHSTKNMVFQELSGVGDVGKVTFTNRIDSQNVDFGNSAADRESETPYFELGYLSGFGTPCDADHGYTLDSFPKKGSYKWVVHQSVCYGYVEGREYGNVWALKDNWRKRGWMKYQRDEEIANGKYNLSDFDTKVNIQGGTGCGWRLDPEGAEPYFESN